VVKSKRIPNKNIKKIFGQPMIYWPLMELKKIFSSENILISTDSELIKERVEAKGTSCTFSAARGFV
jgi:CMP-N-acetylneuraminic acid synthetase